MRNYCFAILVFVFLWPFLFLCAIMYHNNIEVIKKSVRLDFRGISKLEFWLSFVVSLMIAAVISYSIVK